MWITILNKAVLGALVFHKHSLPTLLQDTVQGSDDFAESLMRGVHSMLGNTIGKDLKYSVFVFVVVFPFFNLRIIGFYVYVRWRWGHAKH